MWSSQIDHRARFVLKRANDVVTKNSPLEINAILNVVHVTRQAIMARYQTNREG